GEEFVFSMIREILLTSRLDDGKRLYEIIARQKTRLQASLPQAGHSTAVMRAASYYSPGSYFQEQIAGIAYFRLLEDLEKNFEERKELLIENLGKLMKLIFRPENLMVSVTTDRKGYERVEDRVRSLKEELYTEPAEEG